MLPAPAPFLATTQADGCSKSLRTYHDKKNSVDQPTGRVSSQTTFALADKKQVAKNAQLRGMASHPVPMCINQRAGVPIWPQKYRRLPKFRPMAIALPCPTLLFPPPSSLTHLGTPPGKRSRPNKSGHSSKYGQFLLYCIVWGGGGGGGAHTQAMSFVVFQKKEDTHTHV